MELMKTTRQVQVHLLLQLGNQGSADAQVMGDIFEIAIYNAMLSTGQITEISAAIGAKYLIY